MHVKMIFPAGHRLDLVRFGEMLQNLVNVADRYNEAVDCQGLRFSVDGFVELHIEVGPKTTTLSAFIFMIQDLEFMGGVIIKPMVFIFQPATFDLKTFGKIWIELGAQLYDRSAIVRMLRQADDTLLIEVAARPFTAEIPAMRQLMESLGGEEVVVWEKK